MDKQMLEVAVWLITSFCCSFDSPLHVPTTVSSKSPTLSSLGQLETPGSNPCSLLSPADVILQLTIASHLHSLWLSSFIFLSLELPPALMDWPIEVQDWPSGIRVRLVSCWHFRCHWAMSSPLPSMTMLQSRAWNNLLLFFFSPLNCFIFL